MNEKKNIETECSAVEKQNYIKVKKPNLWKRFVKRSFDICSSGIAIAILVPFFLIFTPIVAIAMKGNPFFVQPRPGKNCKIFRMIKYRTMTNEKDENGNLLPDEVRLTKFGKLMRKLSVDELPELFNIFIGQMSVVGPRPQLVRDMVFFDENAMQRQTVRTVLTYMRRAIRRPRASVRLEKGLSATAAAA